MQAQMGAQTWAVRQNSMDGHSRKVWVFESGLIDMFGVQIRRTEERSSSRGSRLGLYNESSEINLRSRAVGEHTRT